MLKTKFGIYLENFMKKNNYTLEYISTQTFSSLSVVGHYRKGIRIPKDDFIERFIEVFIEDKVEANYVRYLVAYDRTPELIKEKLEEYESPNKIVKVPIKGKAAAGLGYMNFQEMEESINFKISKDRELPRESYFIEVTGNSMFPTLLDGDLVLINSSIKDKDSIQGKVCVFNYNDQTYVKRVKIFNEKVKLISDNSDKNSYPDIVIEGEQLEFLECQGIVVESRRKH